MRGIQQRVRDGIMQRTARGWRLRAIRCHIRRQAIDIVASFEKDGKAALVGWRYNAGSEQTAERRAA